jgi:death-on-curing protein
MTEYVSVAQAIELHRRIVDDTGGSHGLRDPGGLASAISQPECSSGGVDLYPTIHEKASVLAFSLINNHACVDGNKRVGHAAMDALLEMNGRALIGAVDEHERVILCVAAGRIDREEFVAWIREHIQLREGINREKTIP